MGTDSKENKVVSIEWYNKRKQDIARASEETQLKANNILEWDLYNKNKTLYIYILLLKNFRKESFKEIFFCMWFILSNYNELDTESINNNIKYWYFLSWSVHNKNIDLIDKEEKILSELKKYWRKKEDIETYKDYYYCILKWISSYFDIDKENTLNFNSIINIVFQLHWKDIFALVKELIENND